MSDIAIQIENISKKYRLGEIGTGTLSHDINRWWSKFRGKGDPYAKVGEINDRTITGDSEYVWALNEITLNVRKGEVLGIIGGNGAGKSTLLKILSRVTAPSEGTVKAKGRIASLLEVGTGFHPEMTGRENIYMNGTIMGMTKNEISSKLDQIVSFAGVERYLDTPVKRYSSGMTVRLGFAIAAHLEPEILIVDEVLAVGDASFQKKAIGKMKNVSQTEGRTVLFVSHNMESIEQLCHRAIELRNGVLFSEGNVTEVIESYLSGGGNNIRFGYGNIDFSHDRKIQGMGEVQFVSVQTFNFKEPQKSMFRSLDCISFKLKLRSNRDYSISVISLVIKDLKGNILVTFRTNDLIDNLNTSIPKGFFEIQINAGEFNLIPGDYLVSLAVSADGIVQDWINDAFNLVIANPDFENIRQRTSSDSKIIIQADWELNKV